MNLTAQDEIGGYVEEVRQALGGLPAAARDELLEDLPEHLAEVLAEGGGTLTERLGSPSAYAAELIASAGIDTGVADPASSGGGLRGQMRDLRDRAGAATRRADVRVGPLLGYGKASDFLVLLRPAWWVLRGYLAAMALAYMFDGNQRLGLLPRLGGDDLAAVLLLAATVAGSIWLGRRGEPAARMPRLLLRGGTAALVIFAVVGFFELDSASRRDGSMSVDSVDYVSQYSDVQDVFVYDGNGKLVENAQLYDQWGNPIQFGEPGCIDAATGNWSASRSRGYPYCPDQAPFRNGSGVPTPEPSFPQGPSPTEPAASPSAPGVVNASPSRE
ncbi:hypothetical protein AB0F72_11180 [Actinoplanes sp. NPDC023936]|uniref:HAAS signaling domain-containing protein n=1 Tax=Actinoplanes sp. NPDC023936 TaxID=3154910 RepID=UPI0033DCC050